MLELRINSCNFLINYNYVMIEDHHSFCSSDILNIPLNEKNKK
jgi:hypothetical protein